MSTARVYIGVFLRFFQFVGNVGCFATGVKIITPLQCFYINCHGVEFHLQLLYLVWCAIIGGLKASQRNFVRWRYLFFFCTLGVLCS